MGKKILDSKILYIILSILISVSVWIWVTSRDENRDRQSFSNLPVTFEETDILEDRNLMIVNQNITASITVRATPLVLATLNNDPPRLTANVADIRTEGTHTVNYTVNLPSSVRPSDVEIISGLGSNAVRVEVARFLQREVPIQGEFRGSVAPGYLAGDAEDFAFSPGVLTISGQAELVNQVAYAKVAVDGEELTENVEKGLPFQLIGASGDPLENLGVSCSVDEIYTVFPIRATAEIPLEVRLIEGGGLRAGDVKVELSAASIMVAGTREAVTALANEGAIVVATIDLATLDDEYVQNGGQLTYQIPLPDELENLSGVSEVKAGITVKKRVETRTFEVTTRISALGTPEGWRADIITQAVQVKVRGSKALLDELTEESIQVVADLRNINQAAGQYTVPASIRLYSTGTVGEVGVLNPNGSTIVISLVREE